MKYFYLKKTAKTKRPSIIKRISSNSSNSNNNTHNDNNDNNDDRIIRLSETPTVNATDEWLMNLGCNRTVIGETTRGRDIILYSMDYYPPHSSSSSVFGKTFDEKDKNLLFLSLVHGNEPIGLVSLLMGAKELFDSSSPPSTTLLNETKDATSDVKSTPPIHIYFLPIVNVDGYQHNLSHNGTEWRLNFGKNTQRCGGDKGGVDLNRNFPYDWRRTSCPSGSKPLSEPESQAVVNVVDRHNVTHLMSLHSLAHKFRGPPLIIHPYCTDRNVEKEMNKTDLSRFRRWSKVMNENVKNVFTTGTAMEAIQYTAYGATIDWAYGEKGVTSFVLEIVPPCERRFCVGDSVFENAELGSKTMTKFVSLVATDASRGRVVGGATLMMVVSSLVLLIVLGLFLRRRRHVCRLFLHPYERIFVPKDKQDMA